MIMCVLLSNLFFFAVSYYDGLYIYFLFRLHVPSGHYSKSPDDAFFRDVALTYASNHEVMKTGAPQCPGEEKETFPQGITNGAQWYDVPGRFMRQFVIPTFFFMSGYRSSWKSASNSR